MGLTIAILNWLGLWVFCVQNSGVSSLTGPYASRVYVPRGVSILTGWFSASLCKDLFWNSVRMRVGSFPGWRCFPSSAFVFQALRHRRQLHMTCSAYVYIALPTCNCFCKSFSSSIVLIASCGIVTCEAIFRDSLLRYPLVSSLIPVAKIRSLNSFVGSFPVYSLRCGLLGKGGFKVPFPAFEPALMNQVFRKRHWESLSCLYSWVAVS